MKLSANYIAVERIEEEKGDGFETVSIQDSSIYKGRVINVPSAPVYMSDTPVAIGNTVLFAKFSPDTHEIEHEGKKMKLVSVRDLLAVL